MVVAEMLDNGPAHEKLTPTYDKITMIGAGSMVFGACLTEGFNIYVPGASITLHDIDASRLATAKKIDKAISNKYGHDPDNIKATTDLTEAIEGSKVVVNLIQAGGREAIENDIKIASNYGIILPIGDTHNMGIMRALRLLESLDNIVETTRQKAPRAKIFNYSNPMALTMQYLKRTAPDLEAYGLCHSVECTHREIAWYLGMQPGEVHFEGAGINHMVVFTDLQDDEGNDLYPSFYKIAEELPERFTENRKIPDLVRRYWLLQTGYFVSESSEHMFEYAALPGMTMQEAAIKLGIPRNEILIRYDEGVANLKRIQSRINLEGSDAYAAGTNFNGSRESLPRILAALHSEIPQIFYINLQNNGQIPELPDSHIVEVPCRVSKYGIIPCWEKPLPQAWISLMSPFAVSEKYAVQAFTQTNIDDMRKYLIPAFGNDPIFRAYLRGNKITALVDDCIDANRKFLPSRLQN